jgi:phosphoglycolate phosphatase-like HAD superfamily hydrolase
VLLDLDGTLYVLGRFLARPDAPPTHVLVADPSYGATYDDLAADIGGGQAIGAATVLVRSGKGDRPQPGAEAEPDAVVDSVADLPGLLQR